MEGTLYSLNLPKIHLFDHLYLYLPYVGYTRYWLLDSVFLCFCLSGSLLLSSRGVCRACGPREIPIGYRVGRCLYEVILFYCMGRFYRTRSGGCFIVLLFFWLPNRILILRISFYLDYFSCWLLILLDYELCAFLSLSFSRVISFLSDGNALN